MKKIIAIMMALCLLTGFAMAEEINWSDIEDTVADAGIEGEFFSISDIGVKMFIPDVFQEVELSEDDVAEGYICYLTTEDESGTVAVTYADVNGMSLEDYAGYLPEVGATDVELGTLNGIPVVSYEVPENDTVNIAMMTDAGNAIEFVFYPSSDEGFSSVAGIMGASIQPE